MIHVDVWGPCKETSLTNTSFILTVVDDFSRGTWTFLMSHKSQVPTLLRHFIQMVHTQFQRTIRVVRSDNGLEFVNQECQALFLSLGIIHQRSCVYTPQQNGVVERKHRHILEVARSLLFHSHLPLHFQPYSILTAVHIINKLPSSVLNWTTPFEVLYKHPPNYQQLKPFGCLAFAANVHPRKSKFESRSYKCVFLGYVTGKKGYHLFDLDTQRTLVSRDVQFFDKNFPFVPAPDSSSPLPTLSPDVPDTFLYDDSSFDGSPHSLPTVPSISSPNATTQSSSPYSLPSSSSHTSEPLPSTSTPPPEFRRGQRNRSKPIWLQDFVSTCASNQMPLSTASHECEVYPTLSHSFNKPSLFDHAYGTFFENVSSVQEPTTYAQASTKKQWVEAMNKELLALEQNHTWELTTLPTGKKTIGSKWVYKVKLNPDRTIERYKARLVAKGYNQVYGIDYTEFFSCGQIGYSTDDNCYSHYKEMAIISTGH